MYSLPFPQMNNLGWVHDPIENPVPGQRSTSKNTSPRWALHLSPRYGHVVLVSGYMKVHYQRRTYGNGGTLLFFKVWGLAYRRTYGQSREQPKFLRLMVSQIFPGMGLRSHRLGIYLLIIIIIIIKYLYSANILKVQKRFTVRNVKNT